MTTLNLSAHLDASTDSPTNTTNVMGEMRAAWANKPAFLVGAALGGLVPSAAYSLAHFGLDSSLPLSSQPITVAMIGGALVFSAKTVYQWAETAFNGDWLKALGFVVLVEGVMTFAPPQLFWLSCIALAYLVAINAVATGCALARADKVAIEPTPVNQPETHSGFEGYSASRLEQLVKESEARLRNELSTLAKPAKPARKRPQAKTLPKAPRKAVARKPTKATPVALVPVASVAR